MITNPSQAQTTRPTSPCTGAEQYDAGVSGSVDYRTFNNASTMQANTAGAVTTDEQDLYDTGLQGWAENALTNTASIFLNGMGGAGNGVLAVDSGILGCSSSVLNIEAKIQ